MAPPAVRNGINLDGLARLQSDDGHTADRPVRAAVRTEWLGGLLVRSDTEDAGGGEGFRIEADAAPALLGADGGPSAMDLLLAAVGTSFVQSFTLHATARGLVFDALVARVEVTTEARAAVGAPGVRGSGLRGVVLSYAVDAGAQPADIAELSDLACRRAPVLALLRQQCALRVERTERWLRPAPVDVKYR